MNKIYPILTAMFLAGCAPVNKQVVPEPTVGSLEKTVEVSETAALEQAEYMTYSIVEKPDYNNPQVKEARLELVFNGNAEGCEATEVRDLPLASFHARKFQGLLLGLSENVPGELEFYNTNAVLVRKDDDTYIAIGNKDWELEDLWHFSPGSGCDGTVFRNAFQNPLKKNLQKMAQDIYENLGE
jgi:hypothetical protein